MDSKDNMSHIGSEDLFGNAELTPEQKIATDAANAAQIRSEMAEGGAIAGAARVAGDERRRLERLRTGEPEVRPTAYDELGSYDSLAETTATIEAIAHAKKDAAEVAHAMTLRLTSNRIAEAQRLVNIAGRAKVAPTLAQHPSPSDENIAASLEHTAVEEKFKKIIARGKGD